jgi:hypothetical protein
MSFALIISALSGGTTGTPPGGGGGGTFTPIVGADGDTVNGQFKETLHKYTGFPWVAGLSDGHVVSIYKESANHPAAGPLMWGISDGGLSYGYTQLNVPGYGLVECSNLSLGVLTGDKILISWQTNAVDSQMFFAWSSDLGVTWHYIGGVTYHTAADVTGNTGYYAAQYGKPVEMPSGKVLQPFYDAPVNGTDAQHAKFVEINSSLTTLSVGNTISTQTGAAFPNGYHSEVFVVITENTGTDSTCKMVAIQRNETYEAFTHYKSSDGGATWTRNDTYLVNVFAPSGVIDKYPISDIVLRGGNFFLFAGIRFSGDYFIAYASATPTNLFNNTGYSALTRVADCYADTNAASIDAGYPTAVNRVFPDESINEVLVQYYDSNPAWDGFTGEKEERIVQKATLRS